MADRIHPRGLRYRRDRRLFSLDRTSQTEVAADKDYVVRSTFNFVGMVMWFWALGHIELARIAIHFTMPLFIVLLAVMLKERIGPWRITAMLVGFGGVLVILRPGMIDTGLPEQAILGSAMLYGGAVVFLKKVVEAKPRPP